MTTTTELHAAIAQMQVLMTQAADRIAHFADELAKSHTVDGIVKDLDVQLMLESDADLIDHLRAAALPWDQRHKPAAQDPIGYVSEDHGGVIWKGIMPPFGARLTTQAQQAPRVVDCHATGVCVQSGLRAEQQAQQTPAKCWKCGDSDPAFTDVCQVPACGMREDG